MIIYLLHHEQLCNRLWAFLPSLAYALHYKKRIWMLWAFKPYMDLFPQLKASPYVYSFCEKRVFQHRRLYYRLREVYRKTFMLRKSLRDVSPLVPVIFASGWEGREDPSFIIEEKKKIVELFRPSDEVVKSVEALMVKHADTCYVGVHIRRGDYKDFFDGRFYYELPYYYSLMEQMYQLLHHTYRSVIFVICSNEQFDVTSPELLSTVTFSGENILRFEQAGAITDLYALSQCDYLLGPPSTFSQWASFYGNGKLCFVKNRHTVLHMDDFKVVERYESPFKEFRQYWKGKIL